MAKKGQIFKNYSKELKEDVLRKYDEYVPLSVLSQMYEVPAKTISNWVYKRKLGKDVLIDHRQFSSGRPPKEENIDYKEKNEILKKYQAFLKAQREKK